jgi:hypothetical protein
MEDISVEDKFLKIIAKAESNGFQFRTGFGICDIEHIGLGRFIVQFNVDEEQKEHFEFHINELFFNHNFARAFFGDYEVCANCGHKLKSADWKVNSCTSCGGKLVDCELTNTLEIWQSELKKLVLEKNVLDCLFKMI